MKFELCLENSPRVAPTAVTREQTNSSAAGSSKTATPTSPKVSSSDSKKNYLKTKTENEIDSGRRKVEIATSDDEADEIEHDLLALVEKEQKKIRESLEEKSPMKNIRQSTLIVPSKRVSTIAQESPLDLSVETTTKLVHPAKDRPKRANVQRPARRQPNSNLHDSSSDGALDVDEIPPAEIQSPTTPNFESVSPLTIPEPQKIENPIK